MNNDTMQYMLEKLSRQGVKINRKVFNNKVESMVTELEIGDCPIFEGNAPCAMWARCTLLGETIDNHIASEKEKEKEEECICTCDGRSLCYECCRTDEGPTPYRKAKEEK